MYAHVYLSILFWKMSSQLLHLNDFYLHSYWIKLSFKNISCVCTVIIYTWYLKYCFRANSFPHNLHLNVFSSVCVHEWWSIYTVLTFEWQLARVVITKHTNKIVCFTLKLKSLYPKDKNNLAIYPSILQINCSTGPSGPL